MKSKISKVIIHWVNNTSDEVHKTQLFYFDRVPLEYDQICLGKNGCLNLKYICQYDQAPSPSCDHRVTRNILHGWNAFPDM
jgi:hypothetical protein